MKAWRVREETVRYRAVLPPVESREQLLAPATVASAVRKLVGDDPREHFLTFYLDSRRRVLTCSVTSVGTVASSLAHPREIFRRAIVADASAILVAHTHPSGDPAPSNDDGAVTRRLKEVGDLVGIQLLDHVIVGAASHFSYLTAGQL